MFHPGSRKPCKFGCPHCGSTRSTIWYLSSSELTLSLLRPISYPSSSWKFRRDRESINSKKLEQSWKMLSRRDFLLIILFWTFLIIFFLSVFTAAVAAVICPEETTVITVGAYLLLMMVEKSINLRLKNSISLLFFSRRKKNQRPNITSEKSDLHKFLLFAVNEMFSDFSLIVSLRHASERNSNQFLICSMDSMKWNVGGSFFFG